MKAKTILDAEKKDAIDIATELCYSEEVKRKIAHAKSVYEIGRILKQARLDQVTFPKCLPGIKTMPIILSYTITLVRL